MSCAQIARLSKPFIIETNASDQGMGVVLMQGGHPIAFMSKSLLARHKGYSVYEKELTGHH